MAKQTRKRGTRPAKVLVGVLGIALVLALSAGPVAAAVSNGDLAYDAEDTETGNIFSNTPEGSNEQNLTNFTGVSNPTNGSYPRWSPDGTQISYQAHTTDNEYEIFVMDSDGSNKVNITNDPSDDLYADWSPTGGKLAFSSTRSGSDAEIFSMDADGSNVIQLTFGATAGRLAPLWSPSGTQIGFTEGNTIFLMNADGSGLAAVFVGGILSDWHPSGTRLLIIDIDDSFLYTINLSGGDQTLVSSLQTFWAVYSPDGTKIAFIDVSEGDRQVYTMNVDGTGIFQVTNTLATTHAFVDWQPIITPDPPGPTPTPTPEEARASTTESRELETLPAAGVETAGYALAFAGYGAWRYGRKRWDMRRKRR